MAMEQKGRTCTELQFSVPWGHVAAKAWGSPAGKPVLMVHGTLDNANSFDRLIKFLPVEYYYVCIDLPGHGYSSQFLPGLPLEYFNYVYAVKLVLDKLDWKDCIYIGHSLGGHLGIAYSVLYPGRFKKILLLDALILPPITNKQLVPYIRELYSNAIKLYGNDTSPLYTRDEILYALQFRRNSVLTLEAANALFARAVTKVGDLYKYNRDPRLKIYVSPMFNTSQFISFYKNLSIPIVLIYATSSLERSNYSKLTEVIKLIESSSQITTIPVEGNHDVHNNYPERVAPYICKYLNNDITSKL